MFSSHYTGFEGNTCANNIDECQNATCLHGTCIDGVNSFSCVCNPGFTGHDCAVEINECASSPCQNNATCHDLIGRWVSRSVIITDSFIIVVSHDIIQQSSIIIIMSKRCITVCFRYECVCGTGFTGSDCETKIDYCALHPCVAGSACINKLGYRLCQCRPG